MDIRLHKNDVISLKKWQKIIEVFTKVWVGNSESRML